MSFLLNLLRPYALRLLAWAALGVTILGLALGAKRVIAKGAEAETKARAMKENLNDVAEAARARDRVRLDDGERERLRDKYRKRRDGG